MIKKWFKSVRDYAAQRWLMLAVMLAICVTLMILVGARAGVPLAIGFAAGMACERHKHRVTIKR